MDYQDWLTSISPRDDGTQDNIDEDGKTSRFKETGCMT
jgi:hypothetical protein